MKDQIALSRAKDRTTKRNGWKTAGVSLAVIVGLLFAAWGVLELQYQQRIGILNGEADKVEQDFIRPASGTLTNSSVTAPHFLDSFGCVDTGPCPSVNRDWILLVVPGGEKSLMSAILNREGYTGGKIGPGSVVTNSQGEGTKDRRDMNLEIEPLDSIQPPYTAPSGKQWIQIYISISDNLPVR